MPNAFGHAKDFFDPNLKDGELNKARGLRQFKNGSRSRPEEGDLIVWGPTTWNAYGHVAIVSKVIDDKKADRHEIEYIQQNPGPFGKSREKVRFRDDRTTYRLADSRLLGWLRLSQVAHRRRFLKRCDFPFSFECFFEQLADSRS
jgi:hypothetical protein